MRVEITPAKLRGSLQAIGSKSYAHRMLICAALSTKPCTLFCNGISEDITATINCLQSMGASVIKKQGSLEITPISALPPSPALDCHESGSTARFLLPVAAAMLPKFSMTGRGRLPERPMEPLVSQMMANGCNIDYDHLPLRVEGKLQAGRFALPGGISSQFITGLLLALPMLGGGSDIQLTSPLESASYVDITLDVLDMFGVRADQTQGGYFVPANQSYRAPAQMTVPGDWSNSAFFMALNAVGCEIDVMGLDENSRQGDRSICELLRSLPCPSLDASQVPDLVPVLAAVAALTPGTTVICGASRLRLKESDRISTTCAMLGALGADICPTADGMVINGKKALAGGCVDSAGDHRIAMAAAVAAAGCADNVTILGAQCVNKSYPEFFGHYKALGGSVNVIDGRE